MGFGDQLIAAGLAEELYNEDPSLGPVTITDCHGTPRMQPLWEGNPAIGFGRRRVKCGKGCLPYLEYPYSLETGLTFSKTYRAADHRGHIYLTEQELDRGRQARKTYGHYILIEPSPTDRKNVNRAWPLDSWERMITRLQRTLNYPIVQFDHPHAARLSGIPAIASPTFRDACGLIASAHLVVSLEGGIPFACAALDVPAVVLWGGCVSAPTLAYPEQVNIVDGDPQTPCGSLKPCDHCTVAWRKFDPDMIAKVVLAGAQTVPSTFPAGVM